MIAKVLVGLSNRNIDKTFSYKIPANLETKIKIGIRVLVPFGSLKLEGFVLKIEKEVKEEFELKEIISVIDDEVILTKELLQLGLFISKKTLSTLISSY